MKRRPPRPADPPRRILFAASEVHPFSKTGGLADVAQALPAALAQLGLDVRVVTPVYRGMAEKIGAAPRIAALEVMGHSLVVREHRMERHAIWFLDCPALFVRPAGPYTDGEGQDYADNALRFGAFSQAVAQLALGAAGWRPDVLHGNDWHAGLAPVWLAPEPQRPRCVFTIHNLAYQGRYGRAEYEMLGLPDELWHPEALEFHGGFSFLKAGLICADALTTVSPGYAREIQHPALGEGLDGVLRARSHVFNGIANGIDVQAWDPATDPLLAQRYDRGSVTEGKRANKRALQDLLGLEAGDAPLIGHVGRLASQKGLDLLLAAAEWIDAQPVQLAVLGAGDRALEQGLEDWRRRRPGRIGVRIGYDERLAHLIEAGADLFVMPSRYEPCGLNQMYSQRYGTLPVARRTGGLADTIVDATAATIAAGTATGVLFNDPDVGGITWGLQRALELLAQPAVHRAMQQAGMQRDFSWERAARAYAQLYESLSAEAAVPSAPAPAPPRAGRPGHPRRG